MSGTRPDPQQSTALDAIVDQFEQAWIQGRPVPLEQFLPPEGPLRAQVLVELVHADLECRLKAGEAARVESYLQRYPELAGQPNVVVSLVRHEIDQRRRREPNLSTEEFAARFPQCRTEDFLSDAVANAPTRNTGRETISLRSPSSPSNAAPPRERQRMDPETAQIHVLRVAPDQAGVIPGGGSYRMLKRLGRGSFGEVWQAAAPGGVEVALKVINRPIDEEEAQQELRALELIKQVRHPYLLQTQAFWVVEDRLFIAMELADQTLRGRLAECRRSGLSGIPVAELVPYIRQSAEALDFLHGRRVQHRDVKPENILLLANFAKLADFGLARSHGSCHSVAMSLGGTPLYMAPEAWKGKISPNTDQYSLAMTYAELRLGRRVVTGSSLPDLMENHLHGKYELEPLPSEEKAVLRKALSPDSRNRFPSCSAFAEALAETLPPAPGSRSTIIMQQPPRPQRRPRLLALSALALLLLGAPIVYLVAQLGTPAPFALPETAPAHATAPTKVAPGATAAWQPSNDTTQEDSKHDRYYQRIARRIGNQRVEMIVLPRLGEMLAERKSDLDTYYIMEHKVSVGLFKAFAEANPTNDAWRKFAADDRLPVRSVSVLDAHRFAQWLGGRLPTVDQWDKAAGLYRAKGEKGEGPYRGQWVWHDERLKRLRIGVGKLQGPLLPSETEDDLGPFGCRDMAGNGYEWTRNLHEDNEFVPVDNPNGSESVRLRGRSFDRMAPLKYADVENNLCGEMPYSFVRDDIGFRIVLEGTSAAVGRVRAPGQENKP
jgi:serine/threonine protein kinase